jgi:hypothetical protein
MNKLFAAAAGLLCLSILLLTVASQSAGADDGSGSGAGGAFEGKGYKEILASGLPAECDVKMNVGGSPSVAKLYFSGGNASKIRIEMTTNVAPVGGVSYPTISIVKCKKLYTTMMALITSQDVYKELNDCDWMVVAADSSAAAKQQLMQPAQDPAQLESIPPEDFSCKPWEVDESKFATPGRLCGITEIFQTMIGKYTAAKGTKEGEIIGALMGGLPEVPAGVLPQGESGDLSCDGEGAEPESSCSISSVAFQPEKPKQDSELVCTAEITASAASGGGTGGGTVSATYEIGSFEGKTLASGSMACTALGGGKYSCTSSPELTADKVDAAQDYSCFVRATTSGGGYCSEVGFSKKCEEQGGEEGDEQNCCFNSADNKAKCCPRNQIWDELKQECVNPVEWVKVIGSPCASGWPAHEGNLITINNKNYACDLFEVNNPIFAEYAQKAAKCVLNKCQEGYCHSYCSLSLAGSAFTQDSCPKITCRAMKSNFLKAVALYDFYGVGCAADFGLTSYYSPELRCGNGEDKSKKCRVDARWPWLDEMGLTCAKPYSGTPPGTNELAGKVEKCFFVDLPASLSATQMKTGTCVDYSVVLTTLLRASGYAPDAATAGQFQTGEIYTVTTSHHSYNRVRHLADKYFFRWDTTSNACLISTQSKHTECYNDKIKSCPANS